MAKILEKREQKIDRVARRIVNGYFNHQLVPIIALTLEQVLPLLRPVDVIQTGIFCRRVLDVLKPAIDDLPPEQREEFAEQVAKHLLEIYD